MRLATLLLTAALAAFAQDAMDPDASVWQSAPSSNWALHRTPPLYATDSTDALPLASVEVRFIQEGDKTIVRLQWPDGSADATALPEARQMWISEERVVQSPATDRFFDACALMMPANPLEGAIAPSLQMGDADHPVVIYYYSATRGAAVMEATGRGTTHRTSETFSTQSLHEDGKWSVTMELPGIASGTPLSAAIWNGQQNDRDGRKYFSTWYKAP